MTERGSTRTYRIYPQEREKDSGWMMWHLIYDPFASCSTFRSIAVQNRVRWDEEAALNERLFRLLITWTSGRKNLQSL